MARYRSREAETEDVNQRRLQRGAVKRQHLARWAVGYDELAPGVVGPGHLQPTVIETIRDVSSGSGVGQLLVVSATGQSFASGGAYVTADAIVYQHGFDRVTAAGDSIVWPVDAVGEVQVEFAWATYEGGGTIEIEVDGTVPAWGTLAVGSAGQQGRGSRLVHIAEGAVVKVKVTQSSGSAKTGDVHVEFSIPDPTINGNGSLFLDFQSEGWRYKTIGRTDATDYSAVAFDDSAWSVSTATFGTTSVTRQIETSIPIDGRVWLRRTFDGRLTDVTVTVMADNDGEAWWNGEYLGIFGRVGAVDTHEFSVPESALGNNVSHVLAVRVTDDAPSGGGDEHFADASVTGTVLI